MEKKMPVWIKEVGQDVFYAIADFDCREVLPCKITEIADDHIKIVDKDEISFYIPTELMYDIFKTEKEAKQWLAKQPLF